MIGDTRDEAPQRARSDKRYIFSTHSGHQMSHPMPYNHAD